MEPKIAITRLSSQSAISHKLWLQLCLFEGAIALDQSHKQELFRSVLEVIKKLETVKYHGDNLGRIVYEKLQAHEISKGHRAVALIDLTTGAEREFEALLLQAKATLDVVVKVLKPIAGIVLNTYSEGGAKVINALQNNLPEPLPQRADRLIRLVKDATPWVHQWVRANRDTVAHYRSLESSGFIGVPDEHGYLRFSPPQDRTGAPLTEVASSLFQDLFAFCEEFLVFAYRIRIPESFDVRIVKDRERTGGLEPKYELCLSQ